MIRCYCFLVSYYFFLVPSRNAFILLALVCSYIPMLFISSSKSINSSPLFIPVYTFSIFTFSCMPIKSNVAYLRSLITRHTIWHLSSTSSTSNVNHLHHASHHTPRRLVTSCPSTIQPSTFTSKYDPPPGNRGNYNPPGPLIPAPNHRSAIVKTGCIPAYAHHPAPLNITFFSTILAN